MGLLHGSSMRSALMGTSRAVGLLRPEGVEVLRLGVGDELVDLHARAAVEEDAAVAALELVLRALALGRRRVARVLLAVDLSLAVDELARTRTKPGRSREVLTTTGFARSAGTLSPHFFPSSPKRSHWMNHCPSGSFFTPSSLSVNVIGSPGA